MNEKELRESKAVSPDNIGDLSDYIESLTNQEHDYGTCVYAMSLSAVATFNYVASKLGVTGFQASCADLDIVKRIRRIDGPFMLVKVEDALYPQYDLVEKVAGFIEGQKEWLAEQALVKLEETPTAHPDVLLHWAGLAYDPASDEFAAIKERADFLRNKFTEAFVEKNWQEFIRFGIREVYLSGDGDVSKAESCEEGCTFRASLPVSLSFKRVINGITISWSVDTEKAGSNGAAEHHFDFDKLDALLDAASDAVRPAIEAYLQKITQQPPSLTVSGERSVKE